MTDLVRRRRGSTFERTSKGDWLVPVAVSVVLALAVLAPLLGRGFVLDYDMVFVPRQSLLPDALGLGSTLPRSVPADAVVAIATHLLAGDILQKVLLFAALCGGALGAGRLVPTASVATRVVATVGYGWTGFVAERLLIGHWPYLLSYACLPWVTMAGLAVRADRPRALPALVVASAAACLTPTGGLLAAASGVAAAGVRRLRVSVPVAVLLNAPWWVPAVSHPGGTASSAQGVAAFAARSENWGGPVLSLLGLGGIWNSETVPASRGNPLLPVLTVATVAIAMIGLRVLAERWGPAPARAVLLLGALGVLLAALGSVPLGADLLTWMVREVPGGGLLRDGQKWVAWWALPLAVGFALGAERVAARLRARPVLLAAALVPVAVLPDLALGGFGRLATVDYPADWAQVRAVLAGDGRPGDVLALPLSPFRRFSWNAGRTQLDPAPRALPRTTVVDDTLLVGGRVIPGEDRRAAEVRAALAGHAGLGRLGIGWVLLERGTPGRVDPETLAGLDRVYEGDWLVLYRVPGAVAPHAYPAASRTPVLAADASALVLIVLCLLWLALPAGRLGGPDSGKE